MTSSADGRTSQGRAGAGRPGVLRALRVVNAWHDMQRLPTRCIQQQISMYSIGIERAYGISPQHRDIQPLRKALVKDRGQSVSLDIGGALQSTPYRILGGVSCYHLLPLGVIP